MTADYFKDEYILPAAVCRMWEDARQNVTSDSRQSHSVFSRHLSVCSGSLSVKGEEPSRTFLAALPPFLRFHPFFFRFFAPLRHCVYNPRPECFLGNCSAFPINT